MTRTCDEVIFDCEDDLVSTRRTSLYVPIQLMCASDSTMFFVHATEPNEYNVCSSTRHPFHPDMTRRTISFVVSCLSLLHQSSQPLHFPLPPPPLPPFPPSPLSSLFTPHSSLPPLPPFRAAGTASPLRGPSCETASQGTSGDPPSPNVDPPWRRLSRYCEGFAHGLRSCRTRTILASRVGSRSTWTGAKTDGE